MKGSEAERVGGLVGGRQAEEKEMGLIGWDGAENEVSGEEEEVELNNKADMIMEVCRCCRRVFSMFLGSDTFDSLSYNLLAVCLTSASPSSIFLTLLPSSELLKVSLWI